MHDTIHLRNRVRRLVLLAVAAGWTLVAVGCGADEQEPSGTEQRQASFSMPSYYSVASLAKASDAVVVDTVLDDGVKSVDRGHDAPSTDPNVPDPSIPVVVHEFRVESTIARTTAVPETISIVLPAFPNLESEGVSRLAKGQELAIFLLHFPSTGVEGLKEAWVPVSYDNGQFEVQDRDAVARSRNIHSLNDPDSKTAARPLPLTAPRLSTSLAALTATVRAAGLSKPQVTAP